MNIRPPDDWVETDWDTLDKLLAGLNWKKEWETDYFILVHNRERIAWCANENSRAFINPVFLTPPQTA